MEYSDGENIQVQVRVRPLNEMERARGDHECIHVAEDGRTVHFVTGSVGASRSGNPAPSVRALVFDAALAGSSQARVFETAQTYGLLHDALSGLAVTVFAYGQTGSGKVSSRAPDQSSHTLTAS